MNKIDISKIPQKNELLPPTAVKNVIKNEMLPSKTIKNRVMKTRFIYNDNKKWRQIMAINNDDNIAC